ncbi:Putative uncharacterized protein FLJ37770, partial [Habropoda laboriosa]
LSRSQMFVWYARFKDGKKDINNNRKSGGLKIATTGELIEKVRKIVAIDSKVTRRIPVEEFRMSKDTI